MIQDTKEFTELAGAAGGDFDVGVLATTLWRGKWRILLVAVLVTAGTFVYVIISPRVYRAEALLQVRQQSGSIGGLGGLTAFAAQLGAIPPGSGLGLGGGSDREVAIATLRSRAVIEAFINEENLVPKLYASKWDGRARQWKNSGAQDIPTAWQAYNRFTKDIMSTTEDRRSGLVTLAIEWTNPVEAQQWVAELIAQTNSQLRDRAIREGEQNLAYLYSQADRIGQVALTNSIYNLVEEQLKRLMIAKGGEEFAFRVIDPAVVPQKPVRPKTVALLAGGVASGGALGVILVLWWETRRRLRQDSGSRRM